MWDADRGGEITQRDLAERQLDAQFFAQFQGQRQILLTESADGGAKMPYQKLSASMGAVFCAT